MDYEAPIIDMKFALRSVAGYRQVEALPGCEEADWDFLEAALEEAGRLANEVVAPLNRVGDIEGARCENGAVFTANGFKEAYRELSEGGWVGLFGDRDYGGQDLPHAFGAPIMEMWQAANMSFALCNLLTQSACLAISANASDKIKAAYLPKMLSGQWTGTMNLTEPQAGSDLAAIKTKASPNGDGSYRVSGQKIFITYGEHDLTDNIVHLVLARLPGAPMGVRGISLFVVPKFLPTENGGLGARNDLRCVSIEHKLGIHASPTCVMSFGDNEGAVGWLVGEENRGLEYMFVMMNQARFDVGLQGIGIGDRAYQQARAYARDRVQGKPLNGAPGQSIIGHPDVKRMLLTMKSTTEAARALAYVCAVAFDKARRHADEETRKRERAFAEFLVPIVKGWSTEIGNENTYLGVQIHGGVGFVEETGAAQHMRDARIVTIYEGTTGIQAADLAFRKTLRDGGEAMRDCIARAEETVIAAASIANTDITQIRERVDLALQNARTAGEWLLKSGSVDPALAAAISEPFLRLFGTALGGWCMLQAAMAATEQLEAGEGNPEFLNAKIQTAKFYARHIAPRATGLCDAVVASAVIIRDYDAEHF